METPNQPPAAIGGEPPKAAETAASGKSEREALLERQNTKLRNTVTQLAKGKRTAEETAAHAQREAQQLKQLQQEATLAASKPTPQKPEPMSWGFFKG